MLAAEGRAQRPHESLVHAQLALQPAPSCSAAAVPTRAGAPFFDKTPPPRRPIDRGSASRDFVNRPLERATEWPLSGRRADVISGCSLGRPCGNGPVCAGTLDYAQEATLARRGLFAR